MNINNGITPFAVVILPPGSTSADLQAAVNTAGSGDIIEISSDMNFLAAVTIPAGAELTIRSTAGGNWILTQNAALVRHFSVTGNLTLQAVQLTGNDAGGGVVVNDGGTLIINSETQIRNCAAVNGGGAQVLNGGSLLMNGGEFSTNHAQNGGALHAAPAAVVNVDGGTFWGNRADFNGGAIYGYSIRVANTTMQGNAAANNGGGVYGSTGCNIVIEGGNLFSNYAEGSGGAIYANSSSGSRGAVSLNDTLIYNNDAARNGGGVFGNSYCTVTITNTSLEYNNAYGGGSGANGGGGVYGYLFSEITVEGGRISGNTTNGRGGGIFCYHNGRARVMNGALIGGDNFPEGNRAFSGGGIAVFGPAEGTSYLSIYSSSIRFNEAYEFGGGVACLGDYDLETHVQADISACEFNENRAFEGGGMYLTHENALSLHSTNFRANTAERGGGLYYASARPPAQLTVEVGSFENNVAYEKGGGIYGGGLYEFHLAGVLFRNNRAEYMGGGVCVDSGNAYYGAQSQGNVIMESCTLEANESRNGGGIGAMVESIGGTGYCDVQLRSGTQLLNNISFENGGGVFAATYVQSNATAGLTVDVENGVRIADNRAQNGGGAYLRADNYSYGNNQNTLIMRGTIENNAAYDSGGGVYGNAYAGGGGVCRCLIEIESGANVVGNAATSRGGGIYASQDGYSGSPSLIDVRDSVVFGNTANEGGGIYCGRHIEFNLYNAIIENNGHPTFIGGTSFPPAAYGGGVYLSGLANLTGFGGDAFRNNGASYGGGGAIYTEEPSYQNVNTSPATEFSGNVADIAEPPPPNAQELFPNIGFSSVSIFDHPLNNFDIGFKALAGNYMVVYDANGGEGGHVDSDLPYGLNYRILDPLEADVVRIGHSFVMWNTDPSGYGMPYFPGDVIEIIGDLTLYAIWEPNYFNVIYDPNGGVGGTIEWNIPYGAPYRILTAEEAGVSREGYRFLYWQSEPGGGDVYYAGEIIEIQSDMTLYAQWEISEFFTVTYDPNGGIGGYEDYAIPYGTEYTILSPEDFGTSRPGHRFIAWSDTPVANGGGSIYLPGQRVEIFADLTLYAQWEVSDFFTVSYEANGGEGSYIDFGIPYGEFYTILPPGEIGIRRTGHVFTSWNTSADGSGELYVPGDQIEITQDVVLYAQWEVSEFFTVTYDANGGVGGYADENIPYGSDYTILTPEQANVSRTGYRFTAWNTSADGSGTYYFANQTVPITEDMTLYAQWEASEFFFVTYHANGGSGGSVSSGLAYGTLHTILSAADADVSRMGYAFTGWNTSADGTGVAYQPGQIFGIISDLRLYAQWEAAAFFTVTYHANGGVGSHADTNIPYGVEYTILSPVEAGIARVGYTFTGWNTSPDGMGVAYQPGQIVGIISDLSLYAQWEPATFFTVTYHANGGVGSHADTNIPYGAEYTILSSVQAGIARAGYIFVEWNASPNGRTLAEAYHPGDVIVVTDNIDLYARWRASEIPPSTPACRRTGCAMLTPGLRCGICARPRRESGRTEPRNRFRSIIY